MLQQSKKILLAFYGDDLTGSTDALEFICHAGAKAVLFMDPPTIEQLSAYPDLQAYGVAGLTRSLSPEDMEQILLPSFRMIKDTAPRHVHYKVCSTFDSSPMIGSIGKAIDCGADVFPSQFVPVLGGMPVLGRYCLFGNLFARMGIGSNGEIYRIDRHPSMSKHPVTPSTESDLRIHLGNQTKKKIGAIDVTDMEQDTGKWNNFIQSNEKVVLLDALHEEHLQKTGEWLDAQCRNDEPLFSVGSSGIEVALGKRWNKAGTLEPKQKWQAFEKVEQLLVISGSCSPVTKNQIGYALENGFAEVPLEAQGLQGELGKGVSLGVDLSKVISCLKSRQSVIIHTGNIQNVEFPNLSELLGTELGTIARKTCEMAKLRRVVVAGGDTSSYVGRVMGIEALEMIAPVIPGAPLCKAYSKNENINGLEVIFKGGQVGGEDYFVAMMNGES